jgi:hypothetical protein
MTRRQMRYLVGLPLALMGATLVVVIMWLSLASPLAPVNPLISLPAAVACYYAMIAGVWNIIGP